MTLGKQTLEYIDRKKAGLHLLAQSIGTDLESEAKRTASWTDRTGNTRRNIHGGADKAPNGSVIYLAHGAQVGLYLEVGTGIYGPKGKPFEIRPKNKKALRFTVGNQVYFAKRVNHPGIKPQPVIEPTVDANMSKIKRNVRHYWEGT